MSLRAGQAATGLGNSRMGLRRARLRSGRRAVRQTARSAGLALLVALGGCAPVEGWRSLTGVNKNDPDPQTAPFTHNLAEAAAAPYPNLATRPPPPAPVLPAAPRPLAMAEPPPAAVAAAMPLPAPPEPVLAPIAPPQSTAKPAPKRPPAAITVATLEMPASEPLGRQRAEFER